MNNRARYFLAMLSPAILDFALAGSFVLLAGHPEVLAVRLPELVIFLIFVSLGGAYVLYRPIARFTAGKGTPEAATRRIAQLPVVSAGFCLATTLAFALFAFVYTPLWRFHVPATPDVLIVLASRVAIWCVLFPYTVYFLVSDVARRLRKEVFEEHGLIVRAAGGSVRRKLTVAIFGAVFMPVVGITVNMVFVPDHSPISNVPKDVVVAVTFIACVVALSSAMFALSRALVDPLVSLTQVMGRLSSGDLDVRVAVEADDEVGVLTERFNALVTQLERSSLDARVKEEERAAIQQQFHEVQKREALGRLAGGIAHDFNNILAIMLGYAEVTRRKIEDESARARLGEVLKAGERAKHLIRQILAYSRSDDSGLSHLDLTQVVREAANWISETLPPSVTVEVEIAEGTIEVSANATQINQVLTNFCVNAYHAIGEGLGTIKVSLARIDIDGGRAEQLARIDSGAPSDRAIRYFSEEPDGEVRSWLGLLEPGPHARLMVEDNGCGMDATTVQRIFDPYFTTKRVGEGTGLGLAAVLGIVRHHGGAISVSSRAGAGSRFEVFLPIRQSQGNGE